MSGHSKWSSIKHKKGAADARRGKIFTKIIKEITTAARIGGGDPSGNPRLRKAIDDAKAANMPADNMERAIKKGTGELEGVVYEEVAYEGYGPGGVAVLIEAMTDNRNRTVSDIRHLFSKYNGNLGENGCVSWIFEEKGLIEVPLEEADEEKIMEAAIDAGAEDIKNAGDTWEVVTPPDTFEAVRDSIKNAGIAVERAEITKIPGNTVKLEDRTASTMLKLMEKFEDHEDVQNVYANFDISDEILEKLSE